MVYKLRYFTFYLVLIMFGNELKIIRNLTNKNIFDKLFLSI